MANFEKTEKPKATVEDVPDLTPTSSSLDNPKNREEVQDENYGDEPTEFDANEPIDIDGDDVTDTDGVEQGVQLPPLEMVKPQVRRTTRKHRPLTRYSTSKNTMITEEEEPKSF